MIEHHCGIRIGAHGGRWPTAGIDPARAMSTDRPDTLPAEAPVEPDQASKTARSPPERASNRATDALPTITATAGAIGKSP